MKKTESALFLRNILSWGHLLLTCLLVLGIFIFLEIICFNHNIRVDATPGRHYTLSDHTIKVLSLLEEDIKFISFHKPGDRAQLNELYQMFTANCPKIKYRLIDLDRNPGTAEMYGVTRGITLVEYKEKKRTIPYPSEADVVSVILKLIRKKEKVIYFSKGHDEEVEYSRMKQALKNENWNIRDINLVEKKDILPEKSVLIIPGPMKNFLEPEIKQIEQYLHNGGKIIVMLEPFTNLPGLEKFLKDYGIRLSKDIIVDKENKLLGGDFLSPLVPFYSRSPVTANMNASSVFSTARSVDIGEDVNKNITALPFARTSEQSWAMSDMEDVKKATVRFKQGKDKPGPINVAVWVTIQGEIRQSRLANGELICFGDSDFVNDSFYDVLGNKDLFLNTIEWLARETDLISTRPNTFEYPYHFLSASQGRYLFWTSIIIIPSIFMITGIVVFLYRRARG